LASKIAIDLVNSPFIKLLKNKDTIALKIQELIDENLKQERVLDEHVKEILEDNHDEIEFQHIDERQLFFMIKKKLAPEYNVIINYDDRYNDLSHKILDELYENYMIDYKVSDNKVKNVIFRAFKDFAKAYNEIDEIVYNKIVNMEKDYIPGTPEYELIYERLYEYELRKRGMI
jgi:hypothetical protein